eukprot:TRINITY_DN6570_c0_g1_i1.p1 TRINITY_DN6570_c0_g1~~TRINITY_DN6570_c0_g1_i1.p1  ORF type:complete len:433 (+),score=62.68 TRINITY_DN6570_c0_g1_i1:186-1484(+)
MAVFAFFLVVLFLVALLLRYAWSITQRKQTEPTELFKKLQRRYILIFLVSTGADWIQGPYIYALYETYGLSKSDIAVLFLSGFLSSVLFGTFFGSLADKFGRKRASMLYGVLYATSCLTTLVNNFDMLLLGRMLQGISISLLNTVFEAWMVQEHYKQAGTPEGLAKTFAGVTWGNGIVAIVAGYLARFVAQKYGFVAPFMTSAVVLLFVFLLVYSSWHENYGDVDLRLQHLFTTAIVDMRRDLKLPLLGLVQSFFEGAVYIFIFMWTPALQDDKLEGEPLPFSMIFTAFMACSMIGSSLFLLSLRRSSASPEGIIRVVLIVASLIMLIPYFTSSQPILLASFFAFEVCCGLYFPCIAFLRAKYIPEHSRATIMNLFRVPLNLLVVLILVKVVAYSNHTVFLIGSLWIGIAALLQNQLMKSVRYSQSIISDGK